MSDLQTRTDGELVQAWIDNVRSYKAIAHVGAGKRYLGNRTKIAGELRTRHGESLALFRPLLGHPDPEVRYITAFEFREIEPDIFRSTLVALKASGGEIGADAARALSWKPLAKSVIWPETPVDAPIYWQANNQPPPALTQKDIAARLRELLPDHAERLLNFAQPAIGFWPRRRRADLPVDASRMGGMPHAPPDFVWPVRETEPLHFLGQINCADLAGLSGSEHFPSHGLLAMFGDHDTINGCMMTGVGGALFHWPDIDNLVPALPPLELSQIFLVCELAFRPLIDLPHPDSDELQAAIGDVNQQETYRRFYDALRSHGIPDESVPTCCLGKLLGWPDLVQSDDLDMFLDGDGQDFRLLIQLDGYYDGKGVNDWGLGGMLYFMIPEADFANGRLEEAQLTGQFT